MKNEINLTNFKPLPRASEYLISTSGEIYSTKSKRILATSISRSNTTYKYLQVRLSIKGKAYTTLVHKLVAETYLENNISGYSVVDHIDNNSFNNHVDNLRYVTNSQNILRAGKYKKYRKTTDLEVRKIKVLLEAGMSCLSIAKWLGISRVVIDRIFHGKNYKNVPANFDGYTIQELGPSFI